MLAIRFKNVELELKGPHIRKSRHQQKRKHVPYIPKVQARLETVFPTVVKGKK